MTYHVGNISLSRISDFTVFPGLEGSMLIAEARLVIFLRVMISFEIPCVGVARALTGTFRSDRLTFVRPFPCTINDWRSWHFD